MPVLPVLDRNGAKIEELTVNDAFASFRPNKQAVYDYVVMYRRNRRMWTASTKTRGEVRGSNRKPWRQKGTGRARAGSLNSPLFRGGGVTFGPRPKEVYSNLPKKVRRLALKSALAQRLQNKRVFVVEVLKMEKPSTKEAASLLKKMKLQGSTLVVLNDPGRNEMLSVRNLPDVTLRRSDNVNAYDVIAHVNLVLTRECVDRLFGKVSDEGSA